MGVVLGLLTGATVGQAQGPQFSQVTIVGASNVTATGNNAGTFNGKSASSPAFFQGFHYTGGPHLQFNSYTPTVIYPFTVKIVNSGPTFQQVFLTSKGTMYEILGVQVTGGPSPVQLQIFITLTSKAAPTAGYKVATMSFKAFNASGLVFDSGPMTGQWK